MPIVFRHAILCSQCLRITMFFLLQKAGHGSSKSVMEIDSPGHPDLSDSQNVTLLDDDDDDDISLARLSRASKRQARNKNNSKTQSQESFEESSLSAPSTSERSIAKRKLRKPIKQE